ncbi:MAG: RNA polymerase sigma factor [Phycisphaerae bacterium]
MTDEERLTKAVAGDRDALATLLRTYGPQVRQGLKGAIADQYRSSFDEDDVMGVTYCEAIRCIRQLKPTGIAVFVAWLNKMANNNIRDAVRHLNRQRRIPRHRLATARLVDDDSYSELYDHLAGAEATPSHVMARGEARRLLEAAIGRLPADYQKVIQLYELEERDATQVAQLMNRSVGAIYMMRARAIESLRGHMPSISRV